MLLGNKTRQELYVFRTEAVYPTQISCNYHGFNIGRGPYYGNPLAVTGNRDTTDACIVNGAIVNSEKGRIETDDSKLTLKIQPSGFSYELDGSNKAKKTNRFTVQYANGPTEYVPNIDWVQNEPAVIESGITVVDGIRVPLLEDDNDIIYMFLLGTNGSNHSVLVLKYDQKTVGATPSWTPAASSGSISASSFVNGRIAACRTPSGEFAIITTHEGVRGTNSGTVDVLTYIPGSDTVNILKQDIFNFSGTTDTVIDGGCSIESTGDEKFVIALGISRNVDIKINKNEIERSVYIACSDDLVTWTTSYEGKNALGRVEVRDSEESGYAVTDVDYLETSSEKLMFAVTTNGLVLKSNTEGSSWEQIQTPATNKIPLYSVKAMQGKVGEDIIVYAGGHSGFLMRSINGGSTWRIIAAPQLVQFWRDMSVTTRPSNIPGKEFHADPLQWRYDFRPGRSITDVISQQFGWTNADLELPTEQTKELEGQIAVPGLDKNIHTLLTYNQTDANGTVTDTKLVIVHEKGVMVLNEANNTDIEGNWIKPQLRVDGAKTDRMFPIYRVLTNAFIISATIVGEDILLCGNFSNTEKMNKKTPVYVSKPKWSNGSHFLRLSGKNGLQDLYNYDYWENPNDKVGFYFSTDQHDPEEEININNIKSGRIESVTDVHAISSTKAYAIDEDGMLILWEKATSSSDIIETVPRVPINNVRDRATIISNRLYDKNKTFTDLHVYSEFNNSQEVLSIAVQNDKSEIFRSVNLGLSWQKFLIDNQQVTESQFNNSGIDALNWRTAETFHQKLFLGDILIINPEKIMSGIGNQLIIFSVGQRAYPSLRRCSNGTMFMVDSDLERGEVEIWRAYTKEIQDSSFVFFKKIGPNHSTKEDSTGHSITFDIPASNTPMATIASNVPYPDIFELPEGVLAIYAGADIAANLTGDGVSWVPKNDPALPIPLKPIDPYGTYTSAVILKQSKYYVAQNGRVFCVLQDDISLNTFECRKWSKPKSTTTPDGMPILLNKKQWLGLSNTTVFWNFEGKPNDSYEIPINYLYPAENCLKESPSFLYKTAALPAEMFSQRFIYTLEMLFDRQDPELQELLGDGKAFSLDSLGLIKTNFPFMTWAVTVPDYDSNEWPEFSNQYTEFRESAVVHEGTFKKSSDLGSYILDNSQNFRPDMFADGDRTHYIIVQITDTTQEDSRYVFYPNEVVIRKITGNTRDRIYYEGDPIDFSALYEYGNYRIYTDRFFGDGTNGRREGEALNPIAALYDTPYDTGRLVKIRIPIVGMPPEGYIQLGVPFFGKQAPVEFNVDGNTRDANRYSVGWRWNVVSNTSEITSVNGINVISKMGENVNKFVLQYDQIEEWQIQVYRAFLKDRPKQAFILVPDPDKPTSMLYVRLDEDPSFTHAGGIAFNQGVSLKTVI